MKEIHENVDKDNTNLHKPRSFPLNPHSHPIICGLCNNLFKVPCICPREHNRIKELSHCRSVSSESSTNPHHSLSLSLPLNMFLLFFSITTPNMNLWCPWCNCYRRRKWTTATRVQILDLTDCISHSTNTLGKGMNPIILPPAMG